MFRIPLWDIQKCSSKIIGHHQIHGIRILDFHELAAGKLTALSAIPAGSQAVKAEMVEDVPFVDSDRVFPSRSPKSPMRLVENSPISRLDGFSTSSPKVPAGIAAALFARNASRDLFDTHHLLTKTQFNSELLRLAFILYIGMSSIKNPQELSPQSLGFDEVDFRQQLQPVMRNSKNEQNHRSWEEIKLQECKQALASLFPFTEQEEKFLKILIEKGEIRASLLTNEPAMQSKIEKLPLLHWRASLFNPGRV